MYDITIGERIQGLRNDHDWTQKQVAEMIGTTKNQIGKYERNEQEMSAPVLKKFCSLYNVSANYILNLPKNGYDPRQEIIMTKEMIEAIIFLLPFVIAGIIAKKIKN